MCTLLHTKSRLQHPNSLRAKKQSASRVADDPTVKGNPASQVRLCRLQDLAKIFLKGERHNIRNMKLNRAIFLAFIVPIIFLAGVISFFLFLPLELQSITNFVAYLSGLSTSIMVFVYIVIYSRQLDTMSKQLEEMQFSRDVQVQPLPYLQEGKASLKLPRYYIDPSTNFSKMKLASFVNVSFKILNLGNGPAITVDFIPHLFTGPRIKKPVILDKDTFCTPIDCIPLKSNPPQAIDFQFDNGKDGKEILEGLIEDFRIMVSFSIAYKNAIGKPFYEDVSFWLVVMSKKDLETIKSGLKLIHTAPIDFLNQLKQFEKFAQLQREEEQEKIFSEVNQKIHSILGLDQIELKVELARRSFDVHAFSEEAYHKWLDEKAKLEANIRKEIRSCWEKNDELIKYDGLENTS